jgi:hypothetical protein
MITREQTTHTHTHTHTHRRTRTHMHTHAHAEGERVFNVLVLLVLRHVGRLWRAVLLHGTRRALFVIVVTARLLAVRRLCDAPTWARYYAGRGCGVIEQQALA